MVCQGCLWVTWVVLPEVLKSGANGTSFYIAEDISINSMPVDMHSCQMLHFLNAFVAVMQVTKHPPIPLEGYIFYCLLIKFHLLW